MKAAWGCEEKAQMSVPTFVDDGINLIEPNKAKPEHNKYWNCPISWIPENVYGLLKMYDTIKMFPNMPIPPYKDISKRFISAVQYYESKYNEYFALALGEK